MENAKFKVGDKVFIDDDLISYVRFGVARYLYEVVGVDNDPDMICYYLKDVVSSSVICNSIPETFEHGNHKYNMLLFTEENVKNVIISFSDELKKNVDKVMENCDWHDPGKPKSWIERLFHWF